MTNNINTKNILVTSALPYVNNVPHLGNIVGSVLSGDIYTRYYKMKGDNVLFICGTDEYGSTTEIKALQEKLSCKEICDKYHKLHKEVYDWFNINFDIFGRTTTTTQTKITHEIFKELYKNNHIEVKTVSQYYCEKCNLTLADRYLQGYCYNPSCVKLSKEQNAPIISNGDQCDKCGTLIDVNNFESIWCSMCKSKPIKKTTKHLFIKLKDFEKDLENYFINEKKCQMTDNAYKITHAWLKNGLESRCITRDIKWGTPFPKLNEFKELDEFKEKVFYVWFDAPIGYLSILENNISNQTELNKWYSGRIVNFMAKDNVPFHTIIYPATLIGSKKYPLVTDLCSTEYLQYEGTKFSKSKNVGIFGDQIIKLSHLLNIDEDYWRYYLTRIRPETKDSSFSWIEFITLVKSELNDKIGNYINRCISLANKNFPKQQFCFNSEEKEFESVFNDISLKIKRYIELMEQFSFKDGLTICIEIAEYGNTFLQKMKPWDKTQYDDKGRKIIITSSLYVCGILLQLLSPFIPRKTSKLFKNVVVECKNNIFTDKNMVCNFTINMSGYTIPFISLDKTKTFEMLDKLHIYYNN